MQYRELGRTGRHLSVIGFGGILLKAEPQSEADRFVSFAVDQGVNYFDVSPIYGDAEERLGPALKPHRPGVFLACKTRERGAAGAEQELDRSLKRLQTDFLDLYQLHAMATTEDVERALGPGGAVELAVKAKEQGKVRHIGFSAHSAEVAVELISRFPFETVLLPLNFASYWKGDFGPQVVRAAQGKGIGLLAIKAMARTKLPEGTDREKTRWPKCWYTPLDEEGIATLALRFTLSLPVTAAIPPGEKALWEMALREAQNPRPFTAEDEALLREVAGRTEPLFATVHS